MASAGERLTMHGNGPRELSFIATGTETAGTLLAMEAIYPPQSGFPPEHQHPEQEERFTIYSGALTVRLGGETRRYGAGETFVVPRGVAHTMRNAEGGEAHVRWEVRPALRTAEFFTALAGHDPAVGKVAAFGGLATTMREYRREFVLTKVPLPVQRALFAALAPLGRRARRETHQ